VNVCACSSSKRNPQARRCSQSQHFEIHHRINPLCGPVYREESHIAPLGWEHISFNGDYVWPSEPLKQGFRPLRNPRSAFLDAA
jgi:ribosomal protein L32